MAVFPLVMAKTSVSIPTMAFFFEIKSFAFAAWAIWVVIRIWHDFPDLGVQYHDPAFHHKTQDRSAIRSGGLHDDRE